MHRAFFINMKKKQVILELIFYICKDQLKINYHDLQRGITGTS